MFGPITSGISPVLSSLGLPAAPGKAVGDISDSIFDGAGGPLGAVTGRL